MEHEIKYSSLSEEEAGSTRELYQSKKALFSEYIDRLMWWNKKINLVSRDVSRETITQHVKHSLMIAGSRLYKDAILITDSGTGGGLPGIPLAIASPEKEILLNDVVSKKVMACKHMASGLLLKNISSSSLSIEEVEMHDPTLVISKHAFKINDLIALLGDKNWNGIILLKGKEEVEQELEGLKEPLKINIIDLYAGFQDEFYRGKAMVEIEKG